MLVSIIIPCYNQGQFLDKTLQSVFMQTHTNWECIIIDDGSTDNSREVAGLWVNKDNRFQYHQIENSGVSAARNKALKMAKGDWIQFLDADDLLAATKLEDSLIAYNKDNNLNFISSNFRHFTHNSAETSPSFCKLGVEHFTFEKMIFEWNDTFSLPIHCVLLKKELTEKVFFPETLTAQEDWFFWVSVFKKTPRCHFIDEPLVLYRSHPESRIKSKSIIKDQLMVYRLFEKSLTSGEYKKLSEILIERYLKKTEKANRQVLALKQSNTYQAGLMIKKVCRSLGLLVLSRKCFQAIRKLKKKSH